MKILHLSVNKAPFDVMVTGEKGWEFRKPTRWIKSRMFNKDGSVKSYDLVQVTNGYGNHRPQFTAKFKGFYLHFGPFTWEYSNGLQVSVSKDDYAIELGKIISTKNTKP